MSAMRSASSTTTKLDVVEATRRRWLMRSARRPGQATTMSTPRRRALELAAEADAAVDGGDATARRAGQRGELVADLGGQLAGGDQHEGRGAGGARPCSTRATSGMPKARVLPEPVGARPQTSRPARASGSVAAWMGKGSVMPRPARRSTSSAGTPRSAKEGGTKSSAAVKGSGATDRGTIPGGTAHRALHREQRGRWPRFGRTGATSGGPPYRVARKFGPERLRSGHEMVTDGPLASSEKSLKWQLEP